MMWSHLSGHLSSQLRGQPGTPKSTVVGYAQKQQQQLQENTMRKWSKQTWHRHGGRRLCPVA